MEKGRRTGVCVAAAAVVLALVGWLVSSQLAKHRLLTQLGNRDLAPRLEATRKLLAAGKLEDSLAGLPVYKRSYVAEALGEIKGDEPIRLLAKLLRDQEEAPQRRAGNSLIKQGTPAIPTLMAALPVGGGATDNAVRAVAALGKESAPRLRFLLADGGSSAAAAQALAQIDGVGTETLVRGAFCPDAAIRAAALADLAAQKRPETLHAALGNLDATKDPLAQVDGAIAALGVLADPAATPALLPFLSTPRKTAAAASLGLIGDARAVEPILAQLPAGDLAYRNAAVLALGRIGSPAVPALVRDLKSPNLILRRACAQALVGTKSAAANGALVSALADADSQVRAPAARALGWSGNLGAVDALVTALGDKDWRVVDASMIALGEIGPRALPKLLAAVAAPNGNVQARYQISRAMAMMGMDATPQLVSALSSANPEVQKWSATALGAIRDKSAVPALKQLGRASTNGEVRWVVGEQLRMLTGSTKF